MSASTAHESADWSPARVFWLGCSAVLWLVYAALTFGASSIAVADSGHGLAKSAWLFVAAVAGIPIATLIAFANYRRQKGRTLPVDRYGQAMAGVQALGVATILAAVFFPPVALSSYFHPGGAINVDNRSQYAAILELKGDLCSQSKRLAPQTADHVKFVSSALECWGNDPRTLSVLNANGNWSCEWNVARASDPLVVTDDGPSCPVTQYSPGILKMQPTDGGPPFRPPGASPTAAPPKP